MEKQLNVWIDGDLKDALAVRAEEEQTTMKYLVEGILRQDMARTRGEIMEQQAMPVVRNIVQSELNRSMAQLRNDLREDMQAEIVEKIRSMTRNTDNRLAGLIVRTVRETGILRRMVFALTSRLVNYAFALETYENAKEKAGQELSKSTKKEMSNQ